MMDTKPRLELYLTNSNGKVFKSKKTYVNLASARKYARRQVDALNGVIEIKFEGRVVDTIKR